MHCCAEYDIICTYESIFVENCRFNDCGKKMRKPVFRMILTAVGDYAYVRKEDGIIVCPISALKP